MHSPAIPSWTAGVPFLLTPSSLPATLRAHLFHGETTVFSREFDAIVRACTKLLELTVVKEQELTAVLVLNHAWNIVNVERGPVSSLMSFPGFRDVCGSDFRHFSLARIEGRTVLVFRDPVPLSHEAVRRDPHLYQVQIEMLKSLGVPIILCDAGIGHLEGRKPPHIIVANSFYTMSGIPGITFSETLVHPLAGIDSDLLQIGKRARGRSRRLSVETGCVAANPSCVFPAGPQDMAHIQSLGINCVTRDLVSWATMLTDERGSPPVLSLALVLASFLDVDAYQLVNERFLYDRAEYVEVLLQNYLHRLIALLP